MGMKFLLIATCSHVATGVRVVKAPSQTETHALPLCDVATVAQTCAAFTQGSSESVVTIEDIASTFFVTEESVITFLHTLDHDAPTLTCQDLCEKTVASIPADLLPPAAFVGCHMEGSEKVCDVDLSDEGLATLVQSAGSDGHFRNRTGIEKPTSMQAQARSGPTWHQATFSDLQNDISHWFGIWTTIPEKVAGSLAQAGSRGVKNLVYGTVDKTGCTGIGGARNQAELDRITQGYLVDTQRKVRSGCNNLQTLWFGIGADSSSFKEQALSYLSNIARILNNVYYVNWENYPGYWGWVYQGEKYQGKYVIHFGEAYFKDRNDANRIGTMTHEAVHHPPMYTTDHMYCYDSKCDDLKGLARDSKSKARENADNWSFFIDGVVGGGMITGGTCRR